MFFRQKKSGDRVYLQIVENRWEQGRTFSIVWDESSIQWFVNDYKYHEIDISPSYMAEFHDKFFFVFNVAVGGNWPGSPDATTVFPQKMKVDYIRVFQ